MTFGLSAAAIGGIAAGAGAIGGAIISSNAAGDAADTQAQAAGNATQAQRDIFDKQVQLQEPWRQAGTAGLNSLLQGVGLAPNPNADFTNPAANAEVARIAQQQARERAIQQVAQGWNMDPAAIDSNPAAMAEVGKLMATTDADTGNARNLVRVGWNATQETNPLLRDFTMQDYQQDPGFAFRQQQGEQGLERAAAAHGGLGSGKYLKDAMAFNSGLASQEYGNSYNRFKSNQGDRFNRLATLSGIGQTATNQVGTAAGQFGQQIGSNIIGAGNAAAAGQVGSANAINGAIGQGFSMYQQNQLLNRLPMPVSYSGVMPPNPYYTGG